VFQLAWSQLSIAGVTVKVVEPVTPLDVALIVVEPPAVAVARPALLIVATAVVEELHVAVLVRFRVEPSLNVPVAVNCVVLVSVVAEGLPGVTAIEESVGAGAGSSPPPPQALIERTSRVVAA
jgi:hypothetical protein